MLADLTRLKAWLECNQDNGLDLKNESRALPQNE